ncbi:histidine phosphatase family protein [Streptomyces sp. NPDC059740]|uniref:histidine phosphatase family protein n=1 Tax=Streptomyces sp. NPDC059740 TaxID=3346926 RepID=UPI003667A191
MRDLLLIRHGETPWSRSGRHTSYSEQELTPEGEDEARSLRPVLAGRDVAATFVSPRKRALRTADLAGFEDYTVDPDLAEWDYGGYEGITTDEIHRERPDWFLFTDGVAPGGPDHPGEQPADVGARADRVLARLEPLLAQEDGEGDVAVVAHGHFLRVLTARRLGLPPSAGALFTFHTGVVGLIGTEHGRPALLAWNARSI